MSNADDVKQLRREISEARAWAWSEFHREYSERWLGLDAADYAVPVWLADPTPPDRQHWFVPLE